MDICERTGVSKWWLQDFVDEAILYSDDRQLECYVRYLIDQGLAPPPTGLKKGQTWANALDAIQDNLNLDVVDFLDLRPIEDGDKQLWVERDNIPEEHWRSTFLTLRAAYRSLIGKEPRNIRRIPITCAIGLLEYALRSRTEVHIPDRIKPPIEPMSYQQLLAKGLVTSEELKPEWLRGVSGRAPTPKAGWYPADDDMNPIE